MKDLEAALNYSLTVLAVNRQLARFGNEFVTVSPMENFLACHFKEIFEINDLNQCFSPGSMI